MDALVVLGKANPAACYEYLFPGGAHVDFMSLILKESMDVLGDRMAKVIETGVSNPQAIPREDQVAKQRERVIGALTRRYGDDIALLSNASAPDIDKAKICSMSTALYQQILKLPRKESVPLLRFLYAAAN